MTRNLLTRTESLSVLVRGGHTLSGPHDRIEKCRASPVKYRSVPTGFLMHCTRFGAVSRAVSTPSVQKRPDWRESRKMGGTGGCHNPTTPRSPRRRRVVVKGREGTREDSAFPTTDVWWRRVEGNGRRRPVETGPYVGGPGCPRRRRSRDSGTSLVDVGAGRSRKH